MNKILEKLKGVAAKLGREKVAGRAALAAIANYLVLSGFVSVEDVEHLEGVALALVNVYALVSARQAVTPAAEVEKVEPVAVDVVKVAPTPDDQTG